MQKIDTFMKYVMENFQKYFIPYIDLLIDESSVKYKGQLGIIQYMPQKFTNEVQKDDVHLLSRIY